MAVMLSEAESGSRGRGYSLLIAASLAVMLFASMFLVTPSAEAAQKDGGRRSCGSIHETVHIAIVHKKDVYVNWKNNGRRYDGYGGSYKITNVNTGYQSTWWNVSTAETGGDIVAYDTYSYCAGRNSR